jgi:hypothetical protein
MRYKSKLEVWLVAAIIFVIGVMAAGGNYWIGCPVLLILTLMALPQEYVTAPDALRVRTALNRWAIPYAAITYVEESSLGPGLGYRVALRIQGNPELMLAPDDPGAFFAELAARAPHLIRRGRSLIAA